MEWVGDTPPLCLVVTLPLPSPLSFTHRAPAAVHLPEGPQELERTAADASQNLRLQQALRLSDARPPDAVVLDLIAVTHGGGRRKQTLQ